jgi:hypothetical protein
MQESVSLRIFVRKKGMNHVQSNGRSEQTPSAMAEKGKFNGSDATTRFPRASCFKKEQSARKLSEDKRQSTYSRVCISLGDSIPGLYCVAWLTQESISLRIFGRKKGMNHVQSNGRSEQTPSTNGRKGEIQRQ